MPIPGSQSVMLPLLNVVAKAGKISYRDLVCKVRKEFSLNDDDASQTLPSGHLKTLDVRVSWASLYLKKAGLLSYPQRGILELTDRGRKVLSESPAAINIKFLNQFPEFVEYYTPQSRKGCREVNFHQFRDESGTPEEILKATFLTLKKKALDEVLDKIKLYSPYFFEQLVVDVLLKMGYGGTRKNAEQAIGQSGDEGVQGIINEDRLGLDTIYIQAKRWEGNIDRPEIQKFAGVLLSKRARKGIFITTSDFTSEAREFCKRLESKIVLISGKELVELIWDHNVGLSISTTYEVKKLDVGYFIAS